MPADNESEKTNPNELENLADTDEDDDDDDREDAGHKRIWDSPIGTGDPIPFDPTKYAPGMSKEELEKLLEDQKK